MDKLKVLVVDDDPMVRETLYEMLTRFAGCYTETAKSGKEGLEKIQNDDFNVVFTDLTMPEMNGIDLIKEAKQTLVKRIVFVHKIFSQTFASIHIKQI